MFQSATLRDSTYVCKRFFRSLRACVQAVFQQRACLCAVVLRRGVTTFAAPFPDRDQAEKAEEGTDLVLRVDYDQLFSRNPLLTFLLGGVTAVTTNTTSATTITTSSSKLNNNDAVVDPSSSVSLKALQCLACGDFFENRLKLTHHQDRICYKRHDTAANALGPGAASSPSSSSSRGSRLRGRHGWLHDIRTTPGAPSTPGAPGTPGAPVRGVAPAGRGRGRGLGRGRGRGVGRCNTEMASASTTTMSVHDAEDEDQPKRRGRGRPRIHPVKGCYACQMSFSVSEVVARAKNN